MTRMYSAEYVKRLRDENQELLDRIFELEQMVGGGKDDETFSQIVQAIKVSGAHARLLTLLMKREYVSHDAIASMLISEGSACTRAAVHIHIIRKELRKIGADIHNKWDHGYYMREADKQALRRAITRTETVAA